VGVAATEHGEMERPRVRQQPPPRVSLGDDGASSAMVNREATTNKEGSPRWWGGAEVGDGVGALEAKRGVHLGVAPAQLPRGVPPGDGIAPPPGVRAPRPI
jgi:hypothetical protein